MTTDLTGYREALARFARMPFPASATKTEIAGVELHDLDAETVGCFVAFNDSGAQDIDGWRALDPERTDSLVACSKVLDRVLDELDGEERGYFLDLHALSLALVHGIDPRLSSPELWRLGHELVASNDLDRAMVVADRLQHVRFSGAFEIGALALEAKGQLDDAIQVLQFGSRKAPAVWPIWRQLGDLLAKRGGPDDVEEARAAYFSALTCPAVDTAEIETRLAQLGP